MKKLKFIAVIICMTTLISGCAVKQEDSTPTKVLKHTANTPAYVIAGVGMAATLAVQGTLIGAGKLLGAGKSNDAEAPKEDVKTETPKEEVKTEAPMDDVKTNNPSEQPAAK